MKHEHKNDQEHDYMDMSVPAIVISSVVVIIVASFSFFGYFNYKDIATENEEIQKTLADYQQELKLVKDELDVLRFESGGQVEELQKKLAQEEKIRKAIEDQISEQNTLAQKNINNLETKLSLSASSQNLAGIIKDWESLVAYIQCDFTLPNSYLKYGTDGSGVVVKFDNSPIKVITNRHVVIGPPLYSLTGCAVKVSGSNQAFSVPANDIEISVNKHDWGILTVNNPDENITNLTRFFPKLCEQKPSLGDSVVVLGYPEIGSVGSVTATEGIISGFDNEYFITSAKVEQGNSGGAAILSKDSCLLGIPTYATLGQVESLARILDIWTVITK